MARTLFPNKQKTPTSLLVTPEVNAWFVEMKARTGLSFGDQVCWLMTYCREEMARNVTEASRLASEKIAGHVATR